MVMSDQLTPLAMHDALLLKAPDGASHDEALCPFCRDWAMASDGVPAGIGQLRDIADAKKPYGEVKYADPGLLEDKVKRYPIDTEAHARAAWSYIHQASNAENYTADQLASIRTAISKALEGFGVEAEKKQVEHTKKLADAKSGSKKPINASPDQKASSAESQPVASEGGTSPMETIAVETHEALLEKALRDATASLESEKAALVSEVAALKEAAETVVSEVAELKGENERLNGELDEAQIARKSAEDDLAALRTEIAAKEEAAAQEALTSERAEAVRNLGLFNEDYIADKASRWAEMDEAAWTERLDEWKAAKGASETASTSTDTASAMTGSNEVLSGGEPSARRLALGLI